MPMKGRFPIRRTLEYLQKGEVVLKNRVKILTVNYNTHGQLSDGASCPESTNCPCDNELFSISKTPWIRAITQWSGSVNDGEQVLVDVEGKDHKQITQHVKTILGKTDEVLQAEALARMEAANPANFGPKKYCLKECICEVEGQVPCPGTTPLPKEMTGKYRAQMAAAQD
ncbi:small ribosomal subunit protein mS25 isoform X2 [Salmo salar]|uniref:Small ribosomal subunit protein mS25 isoform X2 n=1 Tax=Salmo salar TaxID=8030 RepID=A0ABM3CR32_SALSA|nr:28S ribosomal protein S25, mitochondrial isoform X2 [Salmo salar]